MTPLGLNLEDMVKEAKDEMKEYIDGKVRRLDLESRKKISELEEQVKKGGGMGRGARSGDTSPSGTGRGIGRQVTGGGPGGRGRGDGMGRGRGG